MRRRPNRETLVDRKNAAHLLFVIDHLRSKLESDSLHQGSDFAQSFGFVHPSRPGNEATLQHDHFRLPDGIIREEAFKRQQFQTDPGKTLRHRNAGDDRSAFVFLPQRLRLLLHTRKRQQRLDDIRLDRDVAHRDQDLGPPMSHADQSSHQTFVRQPQNALGRVQKVPRMVKGVKAHDVSVKHPLQKFLSAFQFPKDLRRREGNVDEEDHFDGPDGRSGVLFGIGDRNDREGMRPPPADDHFGLSARFAEHAGEERQVIIVDPDDVSARDELGDHLAESSVDFLVGVPPAVQPALIPIALQIGEGFVLGVDGGRRRRRRWSRPSVGGGRPPRGADALRSLPLVRLRRGHGARRHRVGSDLPLPLSPSVGRQIEQIDVVETGPQDLLAKAEVHEIQNAFRGHRRGHRRGRRSRSRSGPRPFHRGENVPLLDEKDGNAIHGPQHGPYRLPLVGIQEVLRRNAADRPDPARFSGGGDSVRFGFGDEGFGPASRPGGGLGVAGENDGEVVAYDVDGFARLGLRLRLWLGLSLVVNVEGIVVFVGFRDRIAVVVVVVSLCDRGGQE
mmetsp:Transcript_13122/g.26973  ORF Transcript_13122/g.26973 Transcript_13122/m.26973 type:complete len:561 (-) Transcript_13122:322-2004(-)